MSKKECKDKKECKPCIIKEKINKFKETKVGAFLFKFPEVVIGPLMMLWVFILIVIATNGLGLIKSTDAIRIGTLSIKWYAVFILTGIIFASAFAYYEYPKLGISRETLTDGLLIIVPLSILGTRLYYVFSTWSEHNYKTIIDVLNLTDGGLAIHGGIITAILSVLVFAKIKKINPFYFFDVLVMGLLIGQIIGRWGNFINQEAHGPEVGNSWVFNSLVPGFVKKNMEISGVTYHPTFLYESFLNFIFLVFLMVIRRFRVLKVGDSLGLYLIYYGIIRGAVIEPMRTDQLMIGSQPLNIWASLLLFSLGGIIYLVVKYLVFKKLPYYYDLAIDENLYLKGLEGRQYQKNIKEEKKKAKQKRIEAEQARYQASDEEIIAELNKLEEERKKQDKND
ncbi:MAG TPA: prolipoprotein diacylglyceryl transferase [Acholeplasmataceae bacterium]|jgi:phosphatidylglycerol:prolipoprotein diacylglycerol transferase|nr:prolipoprotein diacylglyceryl transferase [Acholeplasmataceae bacterium]